MLVDGIGKNDKYGLYDVFGNGPVFYKNSTARVVGWETPVSLIYFEGNELKFRFKKELEEYAADFEDEPFKASPLLLDSVFGDVMKKNYREEQPIRRLNYAIQQYKKARSEFVPIQLSPWELEEKLQSGEFLPDIYPAVSEDLLFNVSCYWFPVDVDAILTDFSNRPITCSNEVLVVFADGRKMIGHLGFDGKFYRFGAFRDSRLLGEVYTFDSGLQQVETPEWFLYTHISKPGYRFFRDYVVTPPSRCYTYDGELLEKKTRHHKNVNLLNDLIQFLWKKRAEPRSGGLSTTLAVPEEFLEFDIRDVERVVAPYLASHNVLNPKALERFCGVKLFLEKVGLRTDFELAFRNIVDLNKSGIYGGSKRNICSETLLDHLQKLCKKVGTKNMAELLRDEIELKKHIARIHGTKVVERKVSAADYFLIRDHRCVPKVLKQDPDWCALKAGTLVVFSCDSDERFCAVTTDTKAGLGLNRA